MMLLPNSDLLVDVAQEPELLEGLVAEEESRTPAMQLTAAR